MRRVLAKPAGEPASKYPAAAELPAAGDLRKYASACHELAECETDPARQALFRAMQCAWAAVAAQVERTDDLLTKMRALQRRRLN